MTLPHEPCNSTLTAHTSITSALHVSFSLQVFKTSDPAYAQSTLSHAQELYALANLMPTNGTYCAEVWCGGPGWTRFTSSSIYDDLSLAASWLYVGTGEGAQGAHTHEQH